MKVYQTYRNADMTEGRGPMVPSLTFLHRVDANEYIDVQEGVMGRRAKWSTVEHGDWAVKDIEVLEYSVIAHEMREKERRRQALSKLNDDDLKALGLKRLDKQEF